MGKGEKELVGKSDFEVFPRAKAKFFRGKDLMAIERKKVVQAEEWVDYPDGRRVLVDTLKTPFFPNFLPA